MSSETFGKLVRRVGEAAYSHGMRNEFNSSINTEKKESLTSFFLCLILTL